MKTLLQDLRAKSESLKNNEIIELINSMVEEIIKTDDRLLSVSKSFKSYGTYISVGFANEYHFGEELAKILTRALSGTITHNEDREFHVSDFSERIADLIYESI
jgi:hypothetical protein